MTIAEVLGVVGLFATAVTMVVTAVWSVSKVKQESALTRQSVDTLTARIGELNTKLEHIDQRSDDHDRRIIRLETLAERGGPGDRAAISS